MNVSWLACTWPHRSHPDAQPAPQTIFRFRREHNAWAVDETMRTMLRHTPSAVLALEDRVAATRSAGSLLSWRAIRYGGAIAPPTCCSAMLAWPISTRAVADPFNRLAPLLSRRRALLAGLPDMDLLTRGAGFITRFTITSPIYAVFTFIFFALEAAIMALAPQMVVDWSLSGATSSRRCW